MQKETFEKAIEINKEIHDRKANVAKIKILKDNLIKSNCDLTDEEILIEFEADKIYFDGSDFFQVLDFLIELNEQKITQLEVLFNAIQDDNITGDCQHPYIYLIDSAIDGLYCFKCKESLNPI